MNKLLAILFLSCVCLVANADQALVNRAEVQEYIASTAREHGFSEAELTNLFTRIQPRPQILDIFERPATARPWYVFRPNFVNKKRIDAGAAFWRKHEKEIAEISRAYQVDPAVVVAILDVETLFGKNMGNFRVLDVLSTAAFDYPRRAEFFRKEMTEFLLLARGEKQDPLSFRGSYAGAMGWPQFMPSSFRAYAVDWDRDGRHDIWNTPVDAIASAASYLAQHGWLVDGDTFAPVNVEGEHIAGLIADKFNLHYTVAELMQKGVSPISELKTDQKAVLFVLETEPGQMKYYLGFNNFYVITRYNKSTLYATAVLELAQAIREARMRLASAPANPDKPVKTATKKKKRV
ncbi:membrane-bound lytic murein transglycosylase B [Formivibrio citricus]|uniref:Membrane-bound lytic murein transglycosylase B n=1 Tax=Formivibrio citricus TaxID=83765 RepID=A0A1I4WA00_9NEIS|nr:lytic murein transglycosylase B [Formivibrio citricus]SFN10247.1 membrane-bound lytic murein transglycosylase B [Formivibrio citricus]